MTMIDWSKFDITETDISPQVGEGQSKTDTHIGEDAQPRQLSSRNTKQR